MPTLPAAWAVCRGRANGLRRFYCAGCGKTFNALTGTSLARLRKKECWLAYGEALAAGMSLTKAAAHCGVHLTTSFRRAPSIQKLVNAAFTPLPKTNEQRTQADYVPLAAYRVDPSGRPSVIALPVPRPYSDFGKIVQWRIEESLPRFAGW